MGVEIEPSIARFGRGEHRADVPAALFDRFRSRSRFPLRFNPIPKEITMSASIRLARYATLAAVPATITSAAVGDTYHASSNTPIGFTVSTSLSNVSTIALGTWGGMQFDIRGWASSYGGSAAIRRDGAIDMPGTADDLRFFQGGSVSRLVSQGTTPDFMHADMANFRYSNSSGSSGYLTLGTNYLGFSVANGTTGTVVNAFLQYDLAWDGSTLQFTILNWAYNIDAPITMPANSGGGGAVPGLGGLAALACGAAGVRRRRQRVA